jgi:hypothetical protein
VTKKRNPILVSRLARQRQVRRTARLIRGIGVVVLVGSLLLLYVWQRVRTYELAQEISKRERSVRELDKEVLRLKAIRDELASFDRIRHEAWASSKLGPNKKYSLQVSPKLRSLIEEDIRESEEAIEEHQGSVDDQSAASNTGAER